MDLGPQLVLHLLRRLRMDHSPVEAPPCPYLRDCIMYLVCRPFHISYTRAERLFSWGAAAMCTGAVDNMAELIVCRCLLGVFEAAFGAGAPYFLSLFYQRYELGFRVSLLLGMSPVANCFASALAYGITQIKHSIAPWRYLFIIGELLVPRYLIYRSLHKQRVLPPLSSLL